MRVQALLQQQLAGYHDLLEQTIADCQQEALDKNLPGATITSVGSIYAHAVFSEDEIVHGMLHPSAEVRRPRPHAQRRETTPRVRPSGAASHLDLFEHPASFSVTG